MRNYYVWRSVLLFCWMLGAVQWTVNGQSSTPANNATLAKAFDKIYTEVRGVRAGQAFYDRKIPGSVALHQTQVEQFLQSLQLARLEELGQLQFPELKAKIDQKVSPDNKLTSMALQFLSSRFTTFESFLKEIKLERRYPEQLLQMQAAVAGLPAAAKSVSPIISGSTPIAESVTITNARTASGNASAGRPGVLSGSVAYTTKDLASVVGTAMANASAAGRRPERKEFAANALRALGSRIVVVGLQEKRLKLVSLQPQEDLRWNTYLYTFLDSRDEETVRNSVGQTIVAQCRPDKVGVFIEMRDCRLLGNSWSGPMANVPVSANALRIKDAKPEQTLARAGQGGTESLLDGLYLQRINTFGVGGMMTMEYEPFYLFKNGEIYEEPFWAIAAFDIGKSKSLEPHNWGKFEWNSDRKSGRMTRFASSSEDGSLLEQMSGIVRLQPANKGQKLSVTVRSVGGSGNTAIGGSDTVIVENKWRFDADGRFYRDGFAGASSPGVTVGSRAATQTGTYQLDGYSIELRYADGRVDRLAFGALDDRLNMLCVGKTVYTSR
jgi:hypothetical protein